MLVLGGRLFTNVNGASDCFAACVLVGVPPALFSIRPPPNLRLHMSQGIFVFYHTYYTYDIYYTYTNGRVSEQEQRAYKARYIFSWVGGPRAHQGATPSPSKPWPFA